jgi:hypothetical protein
MQALFYKFLSHVFYYIGDSLSRLPWFPYSIYRYCMHMSLNFDEKIGYEIWKEPDKL